MKEEPQEYWQECHACDGSPYATLCTECGGEGGYWVTVAPKSKEEE